MAAQREYDRIDFEIALRRAARSLTQASELGVALQEYDLAAQLLERQVELVKLASDFAQRPTRLVSAAQPRKRRPA